MTPRSANGSGDHRECRGCTDTWLRFTNELGDRRGASPMHLNAASANDAARFAPGGRDRVRAAARPPMARASPRPGWTVCDQPLPRLPLGTLSAPASSRPRKHLRGHRHRRPRCRPWSFVNLVITQAPALSSRAAATGAPGPSATTGRAQGEDVSPHPRRRRLEALRDHLPGENADLFRSSTASKPLPDMCDVEFTVAKAGSTTPDAHRRRSPPRGCRIASRWRRTSRFR